MMADAPGGDADLAGDAELASEPPVPDHEVNDLVAEDPTDEIIAEEAERLRRHKRVLAEEAKSTAPFVRKLLITFLFSAGGVAAIALLWLNIENAPDRELAPIDKEAISNVTAAPGPLTTTTSTIPGEVVPIDFSDLGARFGLDPEEVESLYDSSRQHRGTGASVGAPGGDAALVVSDSGWFTAELTPSVASAIDFISEGEVAAGEYQIFVMFLGAEPDTREHAYQYVLGVAPGDDADVETAPVDEFGRLSLTRGLYFEIGPAGRSLVSYDAVTRESDIWPGFAFHHGASVVFGIPASSVTHDLFFMQATNIPVTDAPDSAPQAATSAAIGLQIG